MSSLRRVGWPPRLLLLLLLVVSGLLSPACLAGVIAEDDGGGIEDGGTTMAVQGTSFVSSVDSGHARVPAPEGATAGSLFIMVSRIIVQVYTYVSKRSL